MTITVESLTNTVKDAGHKGRKRRSMTIAAKTVAYLRGSVKVVDHYDRERRSLSYAEERRPPRYTAKSISS